MMYARLQRIVFCAAILAVLPLADAQPVDLRCDGEQDPAGIDSARPSLSWSLLPESNQDRDVLQRGYRILVASSAANLAKDRGDLWDSGDIRTGVSNGVPYGGERLHSGQQVFWKVAVRTNKKDAPAWSAPSTWTCGILSHGDWAPAKWISSNARAPLGLGYHAQPTFAPNEAKWVEVDLGRDEHIDAVRLYPMLHQGVAGFGFPKRFKVEASTDASFRDAVVVADHTKADFDNPGTTPVTLPTNTTARYVRVTAWSYPKRPNGYCFALNELVVLAGDKNLALGKPVSAQDSVEEFGWAKSALTDGALGPGNNEYESMLLRRTFNVKPGLVHAVLSVTGLGQYEVNVNGDKIGDQLLAPGWTDYRKTVLYDTFDVSKKLRAGANGVGIILGNGMYNIEPTSGRYVKFTQCFGPLKAIAKLQLEYADGTTETVATDSSWEVAAGPITYSNIYGGEDYDARREQAGWDDADFASSAAWDAASETEGPGGALRGQSVSAPPIRAIEDESPVSENKIRSNISIYDLGQNASHMPRLKVRGPAGSYVRIIPSELLGKDGFVDRASCVQDAGGPAWWQYTLKGGGDENYFPKFFYQGCRYFQVERFAGTAGGDLPVIESLDGVVVHSSSAPVGQFECSNPLFNKIYTLVRWAQRSNMMSIMTDCPQREKLGWLEQLHLNGPSLRYNFRLDRLYTKAMNDMADSQQANGFIPNIAPEYFLAASDRFDDPFRNSPEWGSSFVIAAWQQYVFTGDPALLRDHYDQMLRYVDFLGSIAKDGVLKTGLGDWYDLGPKPPWGSQLTPPPFTATAIYFYDLSILSKAASVLGKTDDAARLHAAAERVRKTFNATFYNSEKSIYATGSQCANAMPIALGIVEPAHREAVLHALISDIQKHGNALTAGDVGYRFVLRALADAGRSDVVFAMNNQSDRPGYGMQIKRGATALTEKWDASVGSFGSQDHFMLGQINEWYFHDLAGIQPDESEPGFSHVIIKPAIVGDIQWAKASYVSHYGPINVSWRRSPEGIHLGVIIPPNATATVYVPTSNPAAARMIGSDSAPNSKSSNFACYSIGSGSYEFVGP